MDKRGFVLLVHRMLAPPFGSKVAIPPKVGTFRIRAPSEWAGDNRGAAVLAA